MLGNLPAYSAVFFKYRRGDFEHFYFGFIAVGDEAKHKILCASWDIGKAVGQKASGAAFGHTEGLSLFFKQLCDSFIKMHVVIIEEVVSSYKDVFLCKFKDEKT